MGQADTNQELSPEARQMLEVSNWRDLMRASRQYVDLLEPGSGSNRVEVENAQKACEKLAKEYVARTGTLEPPALPAPEQIPPAMAHVLRETAQANAGLLERSQQLTQWRE